MAASAYAGRNRSAPSRRRPAARKRRPAARSGASRVNWDRVGRIALTLVLLAVAYSYLNPAIEFVKTYTATTAAKAKLHELQHENTRLHKRIQSADEPLVVDRMARAQGMVAEGETPVVVRGGLNN
jgi:cell division protein FtsB